MNEHLDSAHSLDRELSAVVKDFYQSFRFSQGEPSNQRLMLQGIAEKYSPGLRAGLKDYSQALYARLVSLEIPESHSSFDTDGPNAFEVETETLMHTLVGEQQYPELERNSHIAEGMIATDTVYQRPDVGRVHRASDIHLSYFREYVLLAKPTGSRAFDGLFADINQQFLDGKCDPFVYERFDRLAADWEKAHPDEAFLSSEST